MKKKWPLRLLIFVTFDLIALGGAVRALDAGLACPDWPLCLGMVIPHFEWRVYLEFVHRAIAGCVALGTLALTIFIFTRKATSGTDSISNGTATVAVNPLPGGSNSILRSAKKVILLAIGILGTQIILGGLTVLKVLHFKLVSAHLAFGMAFFGCLLWLDFILNASPEIQTPKVPKTIFWILCFAALVVFGQIILGGLVSSNYAGTACPDFPFCYGDPLPALQGKVGYQMVHRFGAYFTVFTILSLSRLLWKSQKELWMNPQILKLSKWIVVVVLLQVCVGVANVIFYVPAILTVTHLALAATLFGTILKILFLGTVRTNRQRSPTT